MKNTSNPASFRPRDGIIVHVATKRVVIHALLLEAMKMPPSPHAWLSRPEWALDKIERLKLTGTIAPLRKLHGEFERCPHALPDHDHYRRYWSLFRVRMLRTIQRLGGEVSAEESRMIMDNPYLQ